MGPRKRSHLALAPWAAPWAALPVALALSLGACGPAGEISSVGSDGRPCRADGTCDEGLLCAAGTCRPGPCAVDNGGCDEHATCTAVAGARTCACDEGFTGDGFTCAAGGPCATDNGGCDANATCADVNGAPGCTCKAGFTGDGVTCTDVDECATNNGGCHANATCTNTPGARTCTCTAGTTGDGVTCTDANECATNNGGCDPNAQCTNFPGSRACACKAGYWGNGLTCAVDPNVCRGATAEWRCYSSTQLDRCDSSGSGPPLHVVSDCPPNYECTTTSGAAACTSTGTCTSGQAMCSDGKLYQCQGGSWSSSTCPAGCVTTPFGGGCATTMATRALGGVFKYELRFPDSEYTDWGDLHEVTGSGFLVLAYRDTQLVDAVLTGVDGAFSVRVPDPTGSTDRLVVMAMRPMPDGTGRAQFAVANPGLTASTTPYPVGTRGASPAAWSWTWPVSALASPASLVVREASGSGAARLFDYLRYGFVLGAMRWAGPRDPVVAWMGEGVGWECGACFWSSPVTTFGQTFARQVLLGGWDQEYYADAVTNHELGHWAMAEFGLSQREAGPHCIGVAAPPNQAWGEGWATWYSSEARCNPIYLDKRKGSMFWLNLATREVHTAGGAVWQRPSASDPAGVLQFLDENDVAAMMWGLSSGQGLGRAWMDYAMASARMTVPPFERGYTKHTWTATNCVISGLTDTGEPASCFADFLDALRCAGVSAAFVDAVTEPGTYYPYASNAPLCRD